MDIIESLDAFPQRYRGCVLSVGKFDGLHLGHARIVSRAKEIASRRGVATVVFTFSPSPAAVLRPESASAPLTDGDEKRFLMARVGVDAMVEYPTTRAFLAQTAEEFFARSVVGQIGASVMVEGASFSFGRNREGGEKQLEALARRFRVAAEFAPPVRIGDAVVSSSAIRRALLEGDAALAGKMLGRRYCVAGTVERGDRRGRSLGYPTANLGGAKVFLPKDALYAAIARLPDGSVRAAAVNLGGNPTFGVEKRKIEAHILDFDGDLYGKPLKLEFCAKLREIEKFPSADALLKQMERDLARTREIVRREMK